MSKGIQDHGLSQERKMKMTFRMSRQTRCGRENGTRKTEEIKEANTNNAFKSEHGLQRERMQVVESCGER